MACRRTYDSFCADFALLSTPPQNPSWSLPVPPQFCLPHRIAPEPAALAVAVRPEGKSSEEDDVQILEAGTSGGRLSYVSLVASCSTLSARRSLPSGVDPPSMKVDNLMADNVEQVADDPLGLQDDSDSDLELPPPILPRRPFSARRLATGSRLPLMAEPKESSLTKTREIALHVDQEPILEFSSRFQCPVQVSGQLRTNDTRRAGWTLLSTMKTLSKVHLPYTSTSICVHVCRSIVKQWSVMGLVGLSS